MRRLSTLGVWGSKVLTVPSLSALRIPTISSSGYELSDRTDFRNHFGHLKGAEEPLFVSVIQANC